MSVTIRGQDTPTDFVARPECLPEGEVPDVYRDQWIITCSRLPATSHHKSPLYGTHRKHNQLHAASINQATNRTNSYSSEADSSSASQDIPYTS